MVTVWLLSRYGLMVTVWLLSRYGLDGSGIESRCGQDFPPPSRPALGAHPASYTMGTGPFPGVGFDGVQLYFCSPSGSSWLVVG